MPRLLISLGLKIQIRFTGFIGDGWRTANCHNKLAGQAMMVYLNAGYGINSRIDAITCIKVNHHCLTSQLVMAICRPPTIADKAGKTNLDLQTQADKQARHDPKALSADFI